MGTAYAISVDSQPAGQTCVVAHGEGVVGGAELFDAVVTCFAPSGRKALTVAAGGDSSFVITEDGALWAWGANFAGSSVMVPVKIVPAQSSSEAASVSGVEQLLVRRRCSDARAQGRRHALGLGRLSGLLGHGQGDPALRPELVGPDYISVAMGESHALGVKVDGTLWAWGSDNYYGQLGTGTLYDWKAEPVPFLIGSGFRAVAAAGATSYATKTDGPSGPGARITVGRLATDYVSTGLSRSSSPRTLPRRWRPGIPPSR